MKISEVKQQKICEQILAHLYTISPKSAFTAHIARELARDEEFIKKLLLDLKSKQFIVEIKKNSEGIRYSRRSRWKLSDAVYKTYKSKQSI